MIDKDKYKGITFSADVLRALIAQHFFKGVDWSKVSHVTIGGTIYLYNHSENTLKPQS